MRFWMTDVSYFLLRGGRVLQHSLRTLFFSQNILFILRNSNITKRNIMKSIGYTVGNLWILSAIFLISEIQCFNIVQDRMQASSLKFSGYDWLVKSSANQKVGPGPNYFSNSNSSVWVDQNGILHMTIRQNQKKQWLCSEVILRPSTGFGKYTLLASSNIDNLDPNVVLGIFMYENDEKEIDIEWSRWGDKNNQNCQFVIQPSRPSSVYRKNVLLHGSDAINTFIWREKTVDFSIQRVDSQQKGTAMNWTIDKSQGDIPPVGDLHFRINLWLVKGMAPQSGKSYEVRFKMFSFEPQL